MAQLNFYPYLSDEDFLLEIDKQQVSQYYAKVSLLDWNENFIAEIQGKVSQGSVSITGSSIVRRTASLTLVVDENEDFNVMQINNLVSINKKLILEVGISNGVKNDTYTSSDYPIIWFPLGVFVIKSASTSYTTSGLTISLSLSDKMCLLNGELGGALPAATQFDEQETIDDSGQWIIKKPTIYQIIQELVNHFGGEQLGNIVISDIDNRIKQVMRWQGSKPLYLQTGSSGEVSAQTAPFTGGIAQSKNTDCGYIQTDFTYPSELVSSIGDNVTTILDKIVSTLGNYEYFYDVYGRFIFQEKKNFLNTTFSTFILNTTTDEDGKIITDKTKFSQDNSQKYLMDFSKGKSVQKFNDANLIASYSVSPQYTNVKNDFIIWGKKESATSGVDLPIRYHLSIDSQPKCQSHDNIIFYTDPEDSLVKARKPYKVSSLPKVGTLGIVYECGNKYYFWNLKSEWEEITDNTPTTITPSDYRDELYLQGVEAGNLGTDSNFYQTELSSEWCKLQDTATGAIKDSVISDPTGIDYWLDIIDTDSSLNQLSVENIGRRTKVLNDDTINCIFEPDIPDVVFIQKNSDITEEEREEAIRKSQVYCQVDETIWNNLATGGMKNSAYNAMLDLLYQYTNYNESISLSCLPIYHLEPNTRITVEDAVSGIHGDYIISNMSLPLSSSGTMSITATKALEKI